MKGVIVIITLSEVKEWLRIDSEDDDNLLESLIKASKVIIKSATGIKKDFILDDTNKEPDFEELKHMYVMVQRILITDLYNEKSVENKALTSLYTQLELEYRRFINAKSG